MSDNVLDTIKQFWDSEEQPVISDQTDVDNDYEVFKNIYTDPSIKEDYETSKLNVEDFYGVSPAKFVGHLEDSPELWEDVNIAADETGVDPNLLYMIGMQEGFGSNEFFGASKWTESAPINFKDHINFIIQDALTNLDSKNILTDYIDPVPYHDLSVLDYSEQADSLKSLKKDWKYDKPFNVKLTDVKNRDKYVKFRGGPRNYSKKHVDTFHSIGLDRFFNEQDSLLDQGFLQNRIYPVNSYSTLNERGDKYKVGDITKGEAWKATGALIRQDAQWMKNTFDNLGLDWNNLSKQEKTFWTYASFNGGPGLAKDILQKYGSMEKVINFVKEFNADPNSDWHKMDFIQYMDNVLRVAGGRDILDIYNPWNYE